MIFLKGILFDLDGTLLDTLDDLEDAVNVTMAAFGWPLRSREEVRSFVGNGVGSLVAQAIPAGLDKAAGEAALEFLRTYYAAHSGDAAVPYPGVTELLHTLNKRGIPMAVVTNKPEGPALRLAEQHFPGLFAAVVGECSDRPRKPAPDMPLYALKQMGLDPEDVVYVGDSEVDIRTARSAGIPVMSVTWGFRDREDLEKLEPDWLIDRPEELLELL